eukprot:g41199.t1
MDKQRDLGVQVHRSLKVAVQVDKEVKKAYGMLILIGRALSIRIDKLCCSFTELKFGHTWNITLQFWPPHYQKDVDALERVQKRYTRMLLGMGDFSNEESLDRLGLFSLECERLRGDLIEVYKIVNGMERVESMRLFLQVEGSMTRGHRFKMRVQDFANIKNILPTSSLSSPNRMLY